MNAKEIAEDMLDYYVKGSTEHYLAQAYLDLLKKWETFQIDITDVPVNSPAGKRFGKILNEEFNKDHVLVPVEPDDKWCRKFEALTNKRWPISNLKREIKAVIKAYIQSHDR